MAVYYFLAIECGPSEEASIKVSEYFHNQVLTLSDGTEVHLESGYLKDKTGNWWAEVIPKGLNMGSPYGSDPRLVDYFAAEVTRNLYELLKESPPFRYATAGYEVEVFAYYEDLEEDINQGPFEGLIISEQIWKDFNKPKEFEEFSRGYCWTPYSEHTRLGYSSWFHKYELMDAFIVNDFITIKLENGDSNIFVKDKMIIQCKHLLLNRTKSDQEVREFKSIDEAEEIFIDSSELDEFDEDFVSVETDFWGHCSNIQTWAENDYNTSLLDMTIAFPVLKKLTEAGDSVALKAFKDEVKKRINSNSIPVAVYLIENGYLYHFSDEELNPLKENLQSYLSSLSEEKRSLYNHQISEAFRNSSYRFYKDSDDLQRVNINKIAVEFEESNHIALYEIGLSYSFLHDYENAEKYFIKSIEINSFDCLTLGELGRVYLKQERYDDIIHIIEKTFKIESIENNATHSSLWYLLGKAYFEKGKLERALDCVNKSISLWPQRSEASELRDEIKSKLS